MEKPSAGKKITALEDSYIFLYGPRDWVAFDLQNGKMTMGLERGLMKFLSCNPCETVGKRPGSHSQVQPRSINRKILERRFLE